MKLTVHPGRSLRGGLNVPGDKSLSHRAALFAAMAEGQSQIKNLQNSKVVQSMLHALQVLGVSWELEGTSLTVHGKGWPSWQAPESPLQCGSSATTLRLLAGALSAAGITAVLDGCAGLRTRPMRRIIEPLSQIGAVITATGAGFAPLSLAGRPAGQPLKGIVYRSPIASAQVKSCLLLAGLAADRPLTIYEPGQSRDHTERMLAAMGAEIEPSQPEPGLGHRIVLQPARLPLKPLEMDLPGDLSSAAFLIVAALIVPDSELLLHKVGLNPTRTGLLDVLKAMGACLQIEHMGSQAGEPYGDILVRSSPLQAVEISGELVVRMIDEFPAFAVAAAFAEGTTVVRGAEELRYKESDRISCLFTELSALNVPIREAPDGFTIRGPVVPSGGQVKVHGDHRLAMALAVAGLGASGPVQIVGAELIHQSFPEFPAQLSHLGADIRMEA